MRRPLLYIFFLWVLLLASCAPGKRAARSFVAQPDPIAVMIVPPSFSYQYFYPFDAQNPGAQFDEPGATEESFFLKDLDLERADEIFFSSLINTLRRYPVRVYTPENFDVFLGLSGERYIFTIAQTEIKEYEEPFVERALIDTIVYRQAFLLNQVARNTWFEMVKVDDHAAEPSMQVLFSNFFTSDIVEGRFRYRPFIGDVIYEYTADVLDLNDVYNLQRQAGQMNARYIFEFLLNSHVQQHARPLLGRPAHFRYDPRSGQITRSRTRDGFLVLDQE